MNLLAIVPCRMGDSEIPDKCTRHDTPDGISLLTRAMHFALELTPYVLVTTPRQPPILPLQRIWWRERPQSLCGPDVPMRDVVNDAVQWWLAHCTAREYPDRWVLLQPTTPSRTLQEVKAAAERAAHNNGITATVDAVPADYAPDRVRGMLPDGQLIGFMDDQADRRQDAIQAFRRNGVAYIGGQPWEIDTPLYGFVTRHHPTLDTLDDWAAFVGHSRAAHKFQPTSPQSVRLESPILNS